MTLPTITVRPETDAHTLCVQLTGRIRREDHKQTIYAGLAGRVERDGWYNMAVYIDPDFEGWEAAAAEISLKSIVRFGKKAARLAYINPGEKMRLRVKLAAPLLGGEVRFFAAEELEQALAWAKAGRPEARA